MKAFLRRFFFGRGQNPNDPKARTRCGLLSTVIGILLNLVLFIIKFLAGSLVGSLAVSADAFNNLSDAGSSLISLVSFRISAKPADRDHPFGHERIEYVASMIISFLILLVGYELAKSSIEKIITPKQTEFEWIVIITLAASVLCKLFMYFLNRGLGKAIQSELLRATAADSISDVASTSAVLVATLIFRFTGFDLDAYMGLAVSAFILFTGIKILNESKNSILGEAPVDDIRHKLDEILSRFPDVLGTHDVIIHTYGPRHNMVSLHCEVDGSVDVFITHDIIDNIERTVKKELNMECTIHMDPIVVGDEAVDALRTRVQDIIGAVDSRIRMHDFRCVIGTTHTNLIFDIAVPFEIKESDSEISEKTVSAIRKSMGKEYYASVTVDRQ